MTTDSDGSHNCLPTGRDVDTLKARRLTQVARVAQLSFDWTGC